MALATEWCYCTQERVKHSYLKYSKSYPKLGIHLHKSGTICILTNKMHENMETVASNRDSVRVLGQI